jgi:hypothetical protein
MADLLLQSFPSHGSTIGAEVNYFTFTGTAHPVDIKGSFRTDPRSCKHFCHKDNPHSSMWLDKPVIADLLVPFLEWWALAHARAVVGRRGRGKELVLKDAPSTFSSTARIYGGWASGIH